MLIRSFGIAATLTLALATAQVRAADFTGTIVDGAGKPIPGAKVWAVVCSEKYPTTEIPSKPILTDAKGKFSLYYGAEYRPRVYIAIVIVAAPGLAPQYPGFVEIDKPLKLVLKRAGMSQSGKVVDREGKPLAGVRVRATSQRIIGAGGEQSTVLLPLLPDGSGAFEAITDAGGAWTLTDLVNTPNKWVIIDRRYLAEPVIGAMNTLIAQPVAQPAAQLTGIVWDIDGKRRGGVIVTARTPSGNAGPFQTSQAVSREDGTFTLGGLDGGIWTVTALVPEGDAVIESRVIHVVRESVQPVGVGLMLQTGVLVEGRVVEEGTGRGVPGITVRGVGRPEATFTTRTDAEGRWFWRALPGPVILNLTGNYPHFRAAEPFRITVPAGERFTVPTVELIPKLGSQRQP